MAQNICGLFRERVICAIENPDFPRNLAKVVTVE